MSKRISTWKRVLLFMESVGVGIFYLAMLAFFLYPLLAASG